MSSGIFDFAAWRLAEPAFLVFALLIPLALFFGRRRPRPSAALAALAVVDAPPPSLRARLVALPRGLQAAAALALVVALARPVERLPLPQEIHGIDVLLCLDVSSSMAARDLDPERTRLDVARDAALDFLAARPQDRVGLLAFARYPDLRCPPTLDHEALRELLRDTGLVAPDGPEDATGIGTALARACSVLSASSGAKVVILLTDGEENVATAQTPGEIAPLHAAQLALDLGARVYVVTVGAAGPPAGAAHADFLRMVERSGGRGYAARDARALQAVYASIDLLETTPAGTPRFFDEERFAPLVLLALGLALLGRLLACGPLEVRP